MGQSRHTFLVRGSKLQPCGTVPTAQGVSHVLFAHWMLVFRCAACAGVAGVSKFSARVVLPSGASCTEVHSCSLGWPASGRTCALVDRLVKLKTHEFVGE